MTRWATQVRALGRAEVQVEWRTGDVIWVAVPFGGAGLLLLAMAVGADLPILRDLGPGLFWAMLLLFGTLVALRPGTVEPVARHDALLLAGLDPSARFVARAGVAALTVLSFGLLLLAVVLVVYDLGVRVVAWMLVVLPMVAVGLGGLGTLAGDLTWGVQQRGLLASLLVLPLAVPLALAGTQVAESVRYGQSVVPWLAMAVTVDVIVALVGIATAASLLGAPPSLQPSKRSS
jgi:heme exporter protein B